MKAVKRLLLTFDYELFLGERSGKVTDCMIRPAEAILHLLDKYSCKAIFFIDTAFIHRLKDQANYDAQPQEDMERITDQLKKIHHSGHDLFLHLHPHWLDAEYLPAENEWSLHNTSKYALQALNNQQIDTQFSEGISLLHGIAGPNYSMNGFRAGGLFIEPFDKLVPFFKKYGIRYDFSLLPKHRAKIGEFEYDYFDCRESGPYFFEKDLRRQLDRGDFAEFPVSIVEISGWQRAAIFLKKKFTRKRQEEIQKGTGARMLLQTKSSGLATISSCSVELMSRENVSIYLKRLRQENFTHFLSHPKSLSAENLEALDRFLSLAKKKYDVETDFRKMLPA